MNTATLLHAARLPVANCETAYRGAEDAPHWANPRDVGRRYADVVTLDACLAHISGLPRRNA